MKRSVALLLAILLILTGCGKVDDSEESDRGFDSARSFIHYYPGERAAETEDTIYFVGQSDSYIKYVDKKTGSGGFLCGKPECQHNDESCNAYTPQLADCLFIDGGRLYWVSKLLSEPDPKETLGYPVYSTALDGTNRREVTRLDRELVPSNPSSFDYYVLHDGYIYLGAVDSVIEDGEKACYNYVCAFPLDPDEEPHVILREKTSSSFNLSMQFYGDDLYIITNPHSAAATEAGEHLYDLKLRRWNVQTGELETLYEDDGSPLMWTMELWVTDEGVFFDRHPRSTNESRIYKYDFETEKCDYQFSTGVEWSYVGIADDVVTGFEISNNEGIYDFHVAIKNFEGNVLVDETYELDLSDTFPYYSNFGLYFLGRDETQAYYSFLGGSTDEGYNGNYTTIVQVALDGSGAKVLCTTVEAG